MSKLDDIRARLVELQKGYKKPESKLETQYLLDGRRIQTGASGHEVFLYEASEDIDYLLTELDKVQNHAMDLSRANGVLTHRMVKAVQLLKAYPAVNPPALHNALLSTLTGSDEE